VIKYEYLKEIFAERILLPVF